MLFFRTANFQQLTLFSQSQFLFIIQQLALLIFEFLDLNPLSANPTKWSSTLKQFVGNFPTNCLRVFDHFLELALKGLMILALCQRTDKFGYLVVERVNVFVRMQVSCFERRVKRVNLEWQVKIAKY